MADQASINWLTPIINEAKTSCEALALDINKATKTIQRWGKYEVKEATIPFSQLAEALGVEENILKAAYKKGCDNDPRQSINKSLICDAFHQVEPTGLTANVLTKLKLETIDEVTDEIASWLQKGDMYPFIKHLNHIIKSEVESVELAEITHLDLIEGFIENIALAASISFDEEKLKKNGKFLISGATQSWALRLWLDATLNLSMTGTSAVNSTQLKTSRAVNIQETKAETDWQRIHEIISNLVNELFVEDDEVVPELMEAEGIDEVSEGIHKYPKFRDYCLNRLDGVIYLSNYMESHSFLYSLQQEPTPVQTLLLQLLPNIRVFICGNSKQNKRVLRTEEKELGLWIAHALFLIKKRREKIKLDYNHPIEEKNMKSNNDTGTNFNIKIENSNANIAIDGATANQLNQVPADYSELIEKLTKLLTEINPDISEHRQLRGDVKEILDSISENEKLPENSKSWLQDNLKKLNLSENVKTGVGAITILEKIIEMI